MLFAGSFVFHLACYVFSLLALVWPFSWLSSCLISTLAASFRLCDKSYAPMSASPVGDAASEPLCAAGASTTTASSPDAPPGDASGVVPPAAAPALPAWSSSDSLPAPQTLAFDPARLDRNDCGLDEDCLPSPPAPPSRDSLEVGDEGDSGWQASAGRELLRSPPAVDSSNVDVFPVHVDDGGAELQVPSDERIPKYLQRYLRVGYHGGLVLTPFAIVGTDSGDQELADAYELAVRHGLLANRGDVERGGEGVAKSNADLPADNEEAAGQVAEMAEKEAPAGVIEPTGEGKTFADSNSVTSGTDVVGSEETALNLASGVAKISLESKSVNSESKTRAASDASKPPDLNLEALESDEAFHFDKVPTFEWKTSQSRKVVLEFGRAVGERRAQHAREAQSGAERARAAAEAASSRFQADNERAPELERMRPTLQSSEPPDPVLWIAQEEAGVAQALRAVRAESQKSAKRTAAGAGGASSGGEESSLWAFFLPKSSSKMRPEAAAEMARAQVAAAAAVEAMREDSEPPPREIQRPVSGSSLSSGGGGFSSGRRARSAPPSASRSRRSAESGASSEGGDDREDGMGTDGSLGEYGDDRDALVDILPAGGFPDRGAGGLRVLDDSKFFAQQRNAQSSRDSISGSPVKSPGFPRARSLGAGASSSLARPVPKKKRVSFTANTIHPI